MTSEKLDSSTSSDFLEDKKRAKKFLGDVLVLGLGKTGLVAAKYCANLLESRVRSLTVYAGDADPEDLSTEAAKLIEDLKSVGAKVVFGSVDISGSYDVCIASPGISQFSNFYKSSKANSKEVISEIEFAWRESALDAQWVAITGTNGKTTTTSLVTHILMCSGLRARSVGNIGSVALEAVWEDAKLQGAHGGVCGDVSKCSTDSTAGDITCGAAGDTPEVFAPTVYVAEVSSYQLASTRYFAPDVAVLLNITPDHLHWHKIMEEYVRAKLRLFDNLGSSSVGSVNSANSAHLANSALKNRCRPVAILDATDDIVRETVRSFKATPEEERGFSYIPIGTKEGYAQSMHDRCGAKNAAYISEGALKVLYEGKTHTFANTQDLQIKGSHNYANALAAASAALAVAQNLNNAAWLCANSNSHVLSDSAITRALTTFKPLEHRIEPCGEIDGVKIYNDSKATNIDATLMALKSFPEKKLVVLLGGLDKDTPLDCLVSEAHARAHHVVCYGQAAPRFSKAFVSAGYENMLVRANNLEEALDKALLVANAGDVVLLSPACASFDEFKSFEHRGEMFKKYVHARA